MLGVRRTVSKQSFWKFWKLEKNKNLPRINWSRCQLTHTFNKRVCHSVLGWHILTSSPWMAHWNRSGMCSLDCCVIFYWMNQPLQALNHPKFKEMISVAARETHGITIPNHKATQKHFINLFKKNLTNLQSQLIVMIFHLCVDFSCQFDLWFSRAIKLGLLASHAMHGNQATRMHTLLLRDTGQRQCWMVIGKSIAHCLGSHSSTHPMMVCSLDGPYSKLWNG